MNLWQVVFRILVWMIWLAVSATGTGVVSPATANALEASLPETVLCELRATCVATHPLIVAARHRLEQVRLGVAGTAGYFDTTLSGAAGGASWAHSVPGSSLGSGILANGVTLETGVERALRPGLFVGAGVAERRLTEPGVGLDDVDQTVAGIQVRVPLLRNRGHAEWVWEHRETVAAMAVATQELTAVTQQICLRLDTAFIDLLEADAALDAYRKSAQRAQALAKEARELVALKAVPAYQVYAAQLDEALREEQVATAQNACEAVRIRLRALVGELPSALDRVSGLVEWAGRCPATPEIDRMDACRRRGDMAAAEARVAVARAAVGGAREALRPSLALAMSAVWQAENPDQPWGTDASAEGDDWGADAALVWHFPVERRRERAAWQARQVRVAELEARRDEQRRVVVSDLERTRNALDAARRCLGLVRAAVQDAERALDAEAERFRLGEGRSRNVLDAQNDLIKAILRRDAAAAAVRRSWAALTYARGYPDGLWGASDETPASETVQDKE